MFISWRRADQKSPEAKPVVPTMIAAIALNRYAKAAGTAAALLGASQFMVGGGIAPLVGALDNGTAVPMAAVIVGTTGLASGIFWSARRQLLDTWDS